MVAGPSFRNYVCGARKRTTRPLRLAARLKMKTISHLSSRGNAIHFTGLVEKEAKVKNSERCLHLQVLDGGDDHDILNDQWDYLSAKLHDGLYFSFHQCVYVCRCTTSHVWHHVGHHMYYGLWMHYYTYVLANYCKHMHLQSPQPSPPPANPTLLMQTPQFLQGINHTNHMNQVSQLIQNKQIKQIVDQVKRLVNLCVLLDVMSKTL